MNNNIVYLITSLMIVVVLTSIVATKTRREAFTDPSVNNETRPQEWTAFDYVCNVKRWNCNSLSPGQRRVLHTMRTLYNAQYTPTGRTFSRRDAIVIPTDHFRIFDRQETDASAMKLRHTDGSETTLAFTNMDDEPQGVVYDTSSTTFQDLVKVLESLYQIYDARFIRNRQSLLKQIAEAEAEQASLRRQWEDLTNRAVSLERRAAQTRRDHAAMKTSLANITRNIRNADSEIVQLTESQNGRPSLIGMAQAAAQAMEGHANAIDAHRC